MTPRILEFEEGRVKITAEAYGIPEVYEIIKKYENDADPYLAYVASFSYPDGVYVRLPKEDQMEAVLYDVKFVYGDFNENDPLLPPAIERLRSLWETQASKIADDLEEELQRWQKYLRETPLGGEEMKNRLAITDKIEKLTETAMRLRKVADDEIKAKMKGSAELGDY